MNDLLHYSAIVTEAVAAAPAGRWDEARVRSVAQELYHAGSDCSMWLFPDHRAAYEQALVLLFWISRMDPFDFQVVVGETLPAHVMVASTRLVPA